MKLNELLDGVALTDLYRTLRVRVLVCAVERGDEVLIPDGRFVLRGTDLLNDALREQALEEMKKEE